MGYDGRAIANFILDFCEENSRAVTNLSLQKIIYFCHVWSLIELGRPLIRHQFEAWQYGPVLQYLYREFKNYDRSPIVGRAKRLDLFTGQKIIAGYGFDTATEELLRRVVDFYSQLRAADLVNLSHAQGGPWDRSWNHDGKINPGMKIDDNRIREYYSKVTPPYSVQ